ncbi:hypothetical protein ACIO1C_27570 [Streptomyces sp. NPDC087420]
MTNRSGRFTLSTRGTLAPHITFHWNGVGFFITPQQSVWVRAVREMIVGS